MENATQFDLNIALQLWLERLGQSSQVKTENLRELESHVRDSVGQLQCKGLSSEESFLVATHRVGSPAKLEPEFAKINRTPWNMIIQGSILVFFAVCCWCLWGILHFPKMMAPVFSGRPLPAFTIFMLDIFLDKSFIAGPPLLAALYCAYIWMRKSLRGSSWIGLFAVTMAVLIFLSLTTFIAVLLPVIDLMNHLGSR